ncbi:flagellar hook-associated protein FlgK [Kineococcus indalonis]|uniref:flagellar hook-associated protein FlgK n=1 Tax=Kineococcus indalonis TaxID=2696566 RepID=UPI001412AFDA|nr:flagellar hook-associated protein FlgK [Kineococcus indalonis]NAZ85447.1 flagellar hook-associated protein FlgK [Kineococcus indalonis]
MSTFSGINMSSRALTAAQRGMEVTGQNIANVNTEGYTRQRVEQTESRAGATGMFARRGTAGEGVEVTGIARVSDALTEAAARQDGATAAEHEAATAVWSRLEANLGENGTSGLSYQLNDMHKAFSDLGNATSAENVLAGRTHALARATNVADTAKQVDAQVQAQWSELGGRIDLHTADVNATAQQIAGFNTAILSAGTTGVSANELLDQREKALSHLSELTGARVVGREGGMVDVYVGNTAIVAGRQAYTMTASHGTSLADVKAGTSSTTLTIEGAAAQPTSGALKATLDAVNTTVPGVSKSIDQSVKDIAAAVNAAYNPGGTGQDLFTFSGARVNGGGASEQIRVNPAVTPSTMQDSTAGTVDRARAKAIGELPTTPDSPTLAWRNTVVDIAAKTQASEIRADLAAQVSLKSIAARDSVSGVNIDEEMTNLVSYQHAYSAAARVLTTIDQALDTLINRTGLVGR